MKNFLKKYILLIPALLFTSLIGVALIVEGIDGGRDFYFILGLLGLMCLTVIMAIIARAKNVKVCAVLAIVLAIACVVVCKSQGATGGLFSVYPVVMLLLALNMIPVFVSTGKNTLLTARATTNSRQVEDMQAQLAQMRSEMERMKEGTTAQETPVAPIQPKTEIVAVPESAPVEGSSEVVPTNGKANVEAVSVPVSVPMPIEGKTEAVVVPKATHALPKTTVNQTQSTRKEAIQRSTKLHGNSAEAIVILEKLSSLHNAGGLTDEEFGKMREKLIDCI